jgi:hypothetical protein
MTEDQLRRMFPHASASFVRANSDRGPGQGPEPERCPQHEPERPDAPEEGHPQKVRVRVTCVRNRLIDPDNLYVKHHIDCLRYAGLVRDDSADEIRLEVTQRKAQALEEEKVILEVFPPAWPETP